MSNARRRIMMAQGGGKTEFDIFISAEGDYTISAEGMRGGVMSRNLYDGQYTLTALATNDCPPILSDNSISYPNIGTRFANKNAIRVNANIILVSIKGYAGAFNLYMYDIYKSAIGADTGNGMLINTPRQMPTNVGYIAFTSFGSFGAFDANRANDFASKLMVVNGATAIPYEPYGVNVLPIYEGDTHIASIPMEGENEGVATLHLTAGTHHLVLNEGTADSLIVTE